MDLIDTYKSLCTEFYDIDKPNAPDAALEFYLSEIRNSSQPILEPMCGSGRFLIPMLELGIYLDGTDASKEMLNSCRKRCDAKGLKPNLFFQKIQELELPRQYGLIFIPSGSFGLITEHEDILNSLERIYNCLLPGGKLVLELLTSSQTQTGESIDIREVRRNDTSKIILTATTSFDKANKLQIIECDYDNLENGEVTLTETESIKLRLYEIDEFSDFLNSAGFSEIESLKPYSEETATEQDDVVLFRCSKLTK